METIKIAGLLSLRNYRDEGETDVLYVSDKPDTPLIERLEEMQCKTVTVRYWTANREAPEQEIKEGFLRELAGALDADLGARYSEITGYLWTDNELKVGGHDLLEELEGHVGKWLIFEAELHASKDRPEA
jgi:hypothetical protein